ncbi:MAG: DNA repair protein RadA [Deltaproteobacteria bacterium]|nr:DNA repair protein RadA [Deltaproteobacteria bacterium]
MQQKKNKTRFFCQNCGHQSPKWLGKCPSCESWNQFVEEEVGQTVSTSNSELQFHEEIVPISAIMAEEGERIPTGIGEMDRVLGGGLVGGSAVLVGGDPGIGKSTLLLQVFQNLATRGFKVLYVTGEESARQVKLRGARIGATSDNLLIMVEISLEAIMQQIVAIKPHVVVIDSIQTVYTGNLSSAPGSVGQVRESSGRLILLAKKLNIPFFLVGHVTKDGSIAGPKVLEHMVDTVLYFEADSGHAYRIIRSIKNRFGPANEIGVFEMRDNGLAEVENPSAFFLAERPAGAAGSVVVPSIEGSRPIMIEIQSLVSPTYLGMPRRTAMGVDHNRVSLLIAVMDKICGLSLGNHDVFLNIAGGIKTAEPAIDMGIVASLASSFHSRPVDVNTAVFGEVGLTGEIRGISRMGDRIKEAARMGFTRCIIPRTTSADDALFPGIQLIKVNNLRELFAHMF